MAPRVGVFPRPRLQRLELLGRGGGFGPPLEDRRGGRAGWRALIGQFGEVRRAQARGRRGYGAVAPLFFLGGGGEKSLAAVHRIGIERFIVQRVHIRVVVVAVRVHARSHRGRQGAVRQDRLGVGVATDCRFVELRIRRAPEAGRVVRSVRIPVFAVTLAVIPRLDASLRALRPRVAPSVRAGLAVVG